MVYTNWEKGYVRLWSDPEENNPFTTAKTSEAKITLSYRASFKNGEVGIEIEDGGTLTVPPGEWKGWVLYDSNHNVIFWTEQYGLVTGDSLVMKGNLAIMRLV